MLWGKEELAYICYATVHTPLLLASHTTMDKLCCSSLS